MAKQKYLKQYKTNYVIIWAPVAAKRKDMVEITKEDALKLLAEQQKTHNQKMADETKVVKVEAEELVEEPKEEASIVIDEVEKGQELPEDDTKESDEEDPDIKMLEEIRIVGKGKAKIELYMLEKYSINVDRRFKLDELVNQAVAKRKEELGVLVVDVEE